MRQQLSRIGAALVILSGFLVVLTTIGNIMFGVEIPNFNIPFMIVAALVFILGGSLCFISQVQDRSLLITAGLIVIAISLYLVQPFLLSLFTLASGAVLMAAGFVGRHQPPKTPFNFDLTNDWHFRNSRGNIKQGSLQAATFVDGSLVVYLFMWNADEKPVENAFGRIREEVMKPRSNDISSTSGEIFGHHAETFMGSTGDGQYFEVYKYYCEPSNAHMLLQISSQEGRTPVSQGRNLVSCHKSFDETGQDRGNSSTPPDS